MGASVFSGDLSLVQSNLRTVLQNYRRIERSNLEILRNSPNDSYTMWIGGDPHSFTRRSLVDSQSRHSLTAVIAKQTGDNLRLAGGKIRVLRETLQEALKATSAEDKLALQKRIDKLQIETQVLVGDTGQVYEAGYKQQQVEASAAIDKIDAILRGDESSERLELMHVDITKLDAKDYESALKRLIDHAQSMEQSIIGGQKELVGKVESVRDAQAKSFETGFMDTLEKLDYLGLNEAKFQQIAEADAAYEDIVAASKSMMADVQQKLSEAV
ncbi:hypothetical protein [Polycladidibacter stylochi]|uniref:hypothetical protein n=1 Tax=Polycladidibacter stylochi TaxID=1807766 RepID=UPI00082A8CBC|nr:hypothetical protein [Pseudovibrio stylochi]